MKMNFMACRASPGANPNWGGPVFANCGGWSGVFPLEFDSGIFHGG